MRTSPPASDAPAPDDSPAVRSACNADDEADADEDEDKRPSLLLSASAADWSVSAASAEAILAAPLLGATSDCSAARTPLPPLPKVAVSSAATSFALPFSRR